MISPAALERAAESIGKAAANGAVIRFGGGHTSTVHEPTVLADVPADAEVLTCEVFAPVLSVILFDDVGQAFASANDTPFGLSCGVFTHSTVEMHQAIETLRFGSVHINETSSARTDEMPFGGIKDSGHGHEGPRYATRAMTEERLITVNP
jgi:succinate-semialdehyde dehydrogenase/glutarate-semialdehyde dehydrogenase